MDGAPGYADATELAPRVHDAAGAAMLAGRQYAAAGFWYGDTLGGACEAADPPRDGTLVSFGPSRPDLVYLRALAPDGPALDAVIRQSLDRVAAGWGVAPVRLERFRC